MANGVSSVVPLLFESLIFVDAITSLDEISWNHGTTRVLGKTSKINCIFYDIWQKGRGSKDQNQISEKI